LFIILVNVFSFGGLILFLLIVGIGYAAMNSQRGSQSSKYTPSQGREQLHRTQAQSSPSPQAVYNQRPNASFCTACGSGVLPSSTFCAECGTKVN
jgi:membrane protease subunit (stomatin/prohibitin family)